MIEYSLNLILKSGKILASDPNLTTMDTVDSYYKETIEILNDTNTKGSFQIVRNGRATIVPILSIDYIEYITDTPDDKS